MAGSKKPIKIVHDVAHPNTSAADASSKPIIVSNRPIMKDPMVKNNDKDPLMDEKKDEKTVLTHSTVIQPLSAPELPDKDKKTADKSQNKDDQPNTDPEMEPTKTEPSDDTNAPEEVSISTEETSEDKQETTKPEESQEESKAEDSKDETKPEETTEEPKTDSQTETKNSESDESTSENENDEQKQIDKSEKTATEIDEAEKRKQQETELEVQKLTSSKKYFLPINTLETRRSHRNVALGILLSIILIVAWLDVALDAGIINMSTSLPHTKFFSQSTPVALTSAPLATTTTFKSYTFSVSNLKVKYPSNWNIDNTSSTSSSDNVTITPPTGSSGTNQTLGAISLNFTSHRAATATGTYLVKAISYKQLPKKANVQTMYIRDIVYEDQSNSEINVSSALVNNQNLKVGDKLTNLTPFFNFDSTSSYQFVISVSKSVDSQIGFKNITLASKFQKTQSYLQARSILFSITN
ncbi:MAG TPA: hypothetical protein VLF63_02015 [Patescibacteria group bacterium]|nr:hypothetical protein [Patescibacteria group bacterium]